MTRYPPKRVDPKKAAAQIAFYKAAHKPDCKCLRCQKTSVFVAKKKGAT